MSMRQLRKVASKGPGSWTDRTFEGFRRKILDWGCPKMSLPYKRIECAFAVLSLQDKDFNADVFETFSTIIISDTLQMRK